jgi:hypothetical protein
MEEKIQCTNGAQGAQPPFQAVTHAVTASRDDSHTPKSECMWLSPAPVPPPPAIFHKLDSYPLT